MFWIRPNSTKYHETSRGLAFTAHLLTVDGDVHVGVVEQRGVGSGTFIDAMPHFIAQLETIKKECGFLHMENLLDRYMDISEGYMGDSPEEVALHHKIADYKPE